MIIVKDRIERVQLTIKEKLIEKYQHMRQHKTEREMGSRKISVWSGILDLDWACSAVLFLNGLFPKINSIFCIVSFSRYGVVDFADSCFNFL